LIPTEGVEEGDVTVVMQLEEGAKVNGETDLDKIAEILEKYLAEDSAKVWSLFGRNGQIVASAGVLPPPQPGSGVPEPATWTLLLLGAVGLGLMRRAAAPKK